LDNVYDNIKLIENYERNAREGCVNLLDYLRIPPTQRSVILGDIMYKNLKFLITEFKLLFTDLAPIINQTKLERFNNYLNEVEKNINNRKLFLQEVYDTNRRLKDIKVKPFYYSTLEVLSQLKIELFIEIKGILYVSSSNPW
jgi:hypothetical protein